MPDLNDGFTKITEGNPCYCITNEKELIGILKWCNLGNNKYSYRIVGVFDKIVREFAELNHLGETFQEYLRLNVLKMEYKNVKEFIH